MKAVRVFGLTHSYGQTTVFDELNLEIEPGERIAVLGENGSGKTTLLRLLAGLIRPTAGTIEILGGSINDPRVRRRFALLGHTPHLYGQLSASENLTFWASMYNCEARPQLLNDLGLDSSDQRRVSTYSQGMRRRVGLASVLQHDPELLLVDEPLTALDQQGRTTVSEMLVANNRTVIATTHDNEWAAQFATRILRVESRGVVEA